MAESVPASLLVADPGRLHREALAQMLAPEGRLRFAASGAEALALAEEEPPDLVLIDAALPEAGGYAACRALRSIPALGELPLLLICGRGDTLEAFRAGAVDVIERPFRPELLLARVRTHLALHMARRRLAEGKAEQEHLLHILCHDLWNPIAAMRSFIGLARRGRLDGELLRYCEGVESCLGHQEAIIERVRELRAQDAGKREAPPLPVALGAAIESAVGLMRARIEGKGLRLALPPAEALRGLAVWAEPVGLTHGVLCNLLSNAIKFSHPGGAIRIAVEREPGFCTLIVQDEGIGIPPSLLERLFRIDLATSRLGTAGERGTGFGMPLVRRVLKRCGGEIAVQSVDEAQSPASHGTTVRVRLRVASPDGAGES